MVWKNITDAEQIRKWANAAGNQPYSTKDESVNASIWQLLPIKFFVGLTLLGFGVYDAIMSFNKGNVTRWIIVKEIEMTVGENTASELDEMDKTLSEFLLNILFSLSFQLFQ